MSDAEREDALGSGEPEHNYHMLTIALRTREPSTGTIASVGNMQAQFRMHHDVNDESRSRRIFLGDKSRFGYSDNEMRTGYAQSRQTCMKARCNSAPSQDAPRLGMT